MTARRPTLGVRLLLLALLAAGLSGCGDDTGGSNAPSAAQTALNGDVFNADDVEFASTMIPHHAQAIELVTLTQGRDLRPEVLALADQIRTLRVTEVETMTTWLTSWGEPIPETSIDHANADSADESTTTPGMVDPGSVSDLADLTDDTAFESQWLDLMAQHHEGAIDLAQAEQERGRLPGAVSLARSIVKDQQNEIEQLTGLAE
ncbi:DUF305 domain-containing protein [Nocardioides salsibiostraticola]